MTVYTITTEGEEALAAATAETILAAAGASTIKGRLIGFGFAFDGIVSTEAPVVWALRRGSSASQGSSTAATEEKKDSDDVSAIVTGFHSFSSEPTYTGQNLMQGNVHPQGGMYEWNAARDEEEWVLDDSTNSFFGLVLTAPAVTNVAGWMVFRG